MTREKAYYILRVSRDEIQSKGHTEFDMLDLPCLDMAIAALREQESAWSAPSYLNFKTGADDTLERAIEGTADWLKQPYKEDA